MRRNTITIELNVMTKLRQINDNLLLLQIIILYDPYPLTINLRIPTCQRGDIRCRGLREVACSHQTWFAACGDYCQGQGVGFPQNRGFPKGKHPAGHKRCGTESHNRT